MKKTKCLKTDEESIYSSLIKKLYKLMIIILIILTGYVCYRAIFDITKVKGDLRPAIIIIGAIIMIMSLIKLKKIISNLSEKKINIIAIILSFAFFIGMSIFGNLLTSIPQHDLIHIMRESNIMLENGGDFVSEYFARFPHQNFMTIIVYYIYQIGLALGVTLKNLNNFATVINSLLMAITAYITYLSVKKLKDEKWGLITLIFFVINPIFYLYSSYFYNDTLCLPFSAIAIYLYLCSRECASKKKTILLLILSGLAIALGVKLRAVLVILLIAMIAANIINKDKIKEKILKSTLLIVGFIIGIVIYMLIALPFGELEDENIKFPTIHFIMMGLNDYSNGNWTSKDFNATLTAGGYEDKIERDMFIIKLRLKDLGISGLWDLSKEKLASTWSNGDHRVIEYFQNVEQFNKLYEFTIGNKNIFFLYGLQICKVVLMLCLLMACINELKNKDDKNKSKFIFISIFGAFLFYLIWEVQRQI